MERHIRLQAPGKITERMRYLAASIAGAALATLVTAAPALAGVCGNAVHCECGDVIVGHAILERDLNGCREDGLRLASGTLDCDGHQISGPGDSTAFVGVKLDGGSDLTVSNCRIRNFRDGIFVNGGSDTLLTANEVFSNTHGIWVGGAAQRAVITSNTVRDNKDEGIHLGSLTSGAVVVANHILRSGRENLYLLDSSDNDIRDNTLGTCKEPSILLKNASHNSISGNTVEDRSVVLRGNSTNNSLSANVLEAGRFTLQAFENDDGWGYPHLNNISGGTILKASTCVVFDGAYANSATDLSVDNCRLFAEREYGGMVPYDNTVSALDTGCSEDCIDDGDDGGGGGGGGGARNRGRIKFSRSERSDDKLRLVVHFVPESQPAPGSDDVVIEFGDSDSLLFRAVIPAGSMRAYSPGFFQTIGRDEQSGVDRLRLQQRANGVWRLDLKARGDFRDADTPEMLTTWSVGDTEVEDQSQWNQRRRGWRMR